MNRIRRISNDLGPPNSSDGRRYLLTLIISESHLDEPGLIVGLPVSSLFQPCQFKPFRAESSDAQTLFSFAGVRCRC